MRSIISLKAASPGLGRLAQSLAMGGSAQQQGYNAEIQNQSRMAQALAQIEQHQASAGKLNAQADQQRAETGLLQQRPDQRLEMSALSAGTSLPMVQAVIEATRTGQPATFSDYGPEPDGSNLRSPVPPELQSKIGQALLRYAPVAMNAKDFKIDDWAQAQGAYRNADLGDAVLNGQRTAADVGRSQAAVAGKPLFNAEANGSVLDNFGGELDTENPMAQSTMALRAAQAGQAGATADLRRKQAGAVRPGGAGGVGGVGGKIPVGYRPVADPETGETRLEPIPGGPKDPNAQTGKPLPASAAKGYLENQTNLRRAMKALELVEGGTVGDAAGDKNATGWKGFLPNGLLNRVDPKGVDTRAAISDLGSLVIHDRSGAAVTAAEMPRLSPFIPSATDDHATVVKKLRQFAQNYREIVESAADFYRASGFNVPNLPEQGAAPQRPAMPAPGKPAAAGGWTYVGKEGP